MPPSQGDTGSQGAANPPSAAAASAGRGGLAFAVAAYGLWGFIPLYFKAIGHVALLEILAHRATWSFVVLAAAVVLSGRSREVARGLGNRRTALLLVASTILIGSNWLLFLYAVESRQVLQSSLGYFINPLVNVLLGVVLLGERLRSLQRVSIALAAAGVAVMAVLAGSVPWLALMLAVSFSLYGLMKKMIPLSGISGLMLETMMLAPPALAYLIYLRQSGSATASGLATYALLAASGVVTTVPLVLFAAAAQRLRLSTLGILQYLSPTLQFLLAVAVFGESFRAAQVASFALIWAAVAVYAFDSLHSTLARRLDVVEPD